MIVKKNYIRMKTDDKAVSPVIAVILMVAITVVLSGVLYVWVTGFGDHNNPGPTGEGIVKENPSYWNVEIIKMSGGTLSLSNMKIKLISKTGTQLFTRTINDANPLSIKVADSTIYPIPSDPSKPVYENSSLGDGETLDTNSMDYPMRWEGCYFAYLDAQSDEKVNAGDVIMVFKDHNDDGIDDVKMGYKIKLQDDSNNNVLTKEF